jgi:hypothetical protein
MQLSTKQIRRPLLRAFSTTASQTEGADQTQKPEKSILHVENAIKHCTAEVKKFDFYAYANGQYMPKSTQPYYYGIHALFLETMKSREISREVSIC